MRFFAVAFVFIGAASFAQTPQVPHKIIFAGMTLTIHEDAKQEIQKDVDALTRSARYFNMKAERARTYFPIIEKIFKEESLPEDFKYLCLQESSLVPDAVSTSNAVGFWQFKDFTAQEMGLRVDNQIDERMNIVSSSRAAAKYIKQNNWYFNNWVLALQAYQMGKGGVIAAIGDKHNGETHMVINSHTYWYVKKFLAHKIAFENAVSDAPQVKVSLYETKDKKNISEIAGEVAIDESVLKEYNKWARAGVIPNDKSYSVSIPNGSMPKDFVVLVMNPSKPVENKTDEVKVSTVIANNSSTPKEKTEVETIFHINGVPVIRALPNENVSSISKRMGIDATEFIDYNDIAIDARIIAGNYYFIKQKKKKGAIPVYQTQAGDNLWSISQQQGIRLSRLKKLNPTIDDRSLASGIIIRLNNKNVEEKLPNDDEVAQLGDESFAWGSQPIYQKENLSTTSTTVSNIVEEQKPVNNTKVVSIDTVQRGKPLPDETQPNTDTIIIYEVKPSDTLYSIARQFDATIKDIMEWNNKSSFSISVGEKLKIKKR